MQSLRIVVDSGSRLHVLSDKLLYVLVINWGKRRERWRFIWWINRLISIGVIVERSSYCFDFIAKEISEALG